jgi:SanA protein
MLKLLKRIFYWIIMAALAGAAAFVGINALMVGVEHRRIYANASDAPARAVAIVPGAAVLRSGALSAVFLDRVDAAIALYEAGKVRKILVSGNGTAGFDEVDPARRYLLSQGIPEADIYLDHAGFDTYSTMYRAHEIFGVTSAIVATQTFHLPRSLFVARALGIDAVGYRADNVHLLARNEMRESLARIKAVWDVSVHRLPLFLGDKVHIE